MTSSSDKSGLIDRIPVHHAFSAIDRTLSIKIDKVCCTVRIYSGSIVNRSRDQSQEQPNLLSCSNNDSAIFLLPIPDLLNKVLTAKSCFVFPPARSFFPQRFASRCRRDPYRAARVLLYPMPGPVLQGYPGLYYSAHAPSSARP